MLCGANLPGESRGGEASNPARWWDRSSFSRQLFPEHLRAVGLGPADLACLPASSTGASPWEPTEGLEERRRLQISCWREAPTSWVLQTMMNADSLHTQDCK